jgi:hypothetical protein
MGPHYARSRSRSGRGWRGHHGCGKAARRNPDGKRAVNWSAADGCGRRGGSGQLDEASLLSVTGQSLVQLAEQFIEARREPANTNA